MTADQKINSLRGPIVIFGGCGFIGINLFNLIAKHRDDCYLVTHNLRDNWRLNLQPEIPPSKILYCDILYKNSVHELFARHNPSTVFNLAAYGAYSKQANARLMYDTNLAGTLNILEECRNVRAFVNAGSSSEYGFNSAGPEENGELSPNSHYAVSKTAASYLIKYYARVHGIPAVHLRLYSAYGPWEEPDRLVPVLVQHARQGKFPPLVSPEVSRDFIYVNDCSEAFIDAALNLKSEDHGCSLNIASGRKTTMCELAELTGRTFGIKESPQWGSMKNRAWDLNEWYGNPGKAEKAIGWKASTTLEEGLRKTAEWQERCSYEKKVLPVFNSPSSGKKISVVVACYRDAQAIPVMYERLVKMFTQLGARYEIIFVNDASPDNTEEVLGPICAADNHVIAITHSRNFGSQAAFLSGMEAASGDGVVLMDGDLQDPPELIAEFYKKWTDGFDVVYGSRVKRETTPVLNFCYKVFYRIFRGVSYVPMPLNAGDFSLMDRKVVNQLLSMPETDQFLRGLRAWVGFKQTGVDYIRPERMFGISTNSWRKNFWWARKAIFSFSFVPLELLTYLGLSLTCLSFIAMIAQVIAKILHPDIPHGITTIIVLILFFGGIQLLAVSVIGEYLGKIFEETKKRPRYIRRSMRKGEKVYSSPEEISAFLGK